MKVIVMALLLAAGTVQAQAVIKVPLGELPGALYFCDEPLIGETCAYVKGDGTVVTPDPDNGWSLPDAEMLTYAHNKHIVASNAYNETGDIRDRMNEYYWAVRMVAARNQPDPDIATYRLVQRLDGIDIAGVLADLDFTEPEVAAGVAATRARLQALYERSVRATALAIWLEHAFGLPYD